MGQIEKRKKKGRPSKADLARRSSSAAPTSSSGATDSQRRRSLRRRNVRYNNFIDFDDYLDDYEDQDEEEEEVVGALDHDDEEEEEEEEEEDERRKEKKLELVLKLHNNQSQSQNYPRRRRRGRTARGSHARRDATGAASSSSSEDEDDDGERKPLKKRRIDGGDSEAEEDKSENDQQGNEEEEEEDDNDHQEQQRETDDKGQPDSVPGTPSDRLDSYPLPDKKVLDLVLHKLQKKDTYGVYSEPVDLEELPDYLDVVDHPMDFATVRKKLGNASYSTLEQFESDILLICSNAMKYNSSDTIYHKQARAIQELAHKKFEKLRVGIERAEKERKSEQKMKSNFSAKKQMKKPLSRAIQETVGSDFSSGATLANAGEVQNGPNGVLAGACERPCSVDALVEGSLSVVDNNLEKLEELSSGKGPWPKIGKRPSVDDNRRATYNICSQPIERPDTIFTTFEDELRQLVAVGLHAEYSYARSMARFAATLGPLAWKVASHRIEQALPPGCKFGRGWVGEYEPITTPVLMIETRAPRDNKALLPKVKAAMDGQNGRDAAEVAAAEHPPPKGTASQAKHTVFRPTCSVPEVRNSLISSAATKPFIPVNVTQPQQTISPRNYVETQNKALKQVELNLPPSNYQNDDEVGGRKQLAKSSDIAPSKVWVAAPRAESPKPREVPPRTESPKPREVPPRTESPKPREVPPRTESPKPRELSRTEASMPQSLPCKQLESYTHLPPGFPNGRNSSSSLVNNSRSATASSDGFGQMGYVGSNQMGRVGGTHYPPRVPGQVLTDPVEAMRISAAERAQKHQQPTSGGQFSAAEAPQASRSDCSNAAATAARAWMSIGAAGGGFKPPAAETSTSNTKGKISAESLYNPTWQLPPRVFQGQFPLAGAGVQQQFQQADKNFPFQAFMRPPSFPGGGEGGQLQGGRPVMFSPQLIATDLSRLQMMSSPWRGQSGPPSQSQSQPATKQKQETHTLPPDLNIGFQSPGSPVKQSSGVSVDSQQPDLALQL